jgi:hypothetical protein
LEDEKISLVGKSEKETGLLNILTDVIGWALLSTE